MANGEFQYSPWRHGGWYVDNVHYPSGAVGCVSRNYPDRKWRIVCDTREGDHTYRTRDEAAGAERDLIAAGVLGREDGRRMLLVIRNLSDENAAEATRAVADLLDEGYTSGIDPLSFDTLEEGDGRIVELTDGMYRALCGLVHPSDTLDPGEVVADFPEWDRLRELFPLVDARTVHNQETEPGENCPRCGEPGISRGRTREGSAWNCESCGLPFQVIETD